MNKEDIKAYIESSKTIIEIAGPSPDGYAYFTDHDISVPTWTITNYKNPITINPFGEHPINTNVDRVVNARHMPFANDSVDMFLVSYLSNSSDFYMDMKPRPIRTIMSNILSYIVKREYKQQNVHAKVNLRIQFLKEAYRCLRNNGLVVMVGPFEDDYSIAMKLGFEILERNFIASDESETAILKKSAR